MEYYFAGRNSHKKGLGIKKKNNNCYIYKD